MKWSITLLVLALALSVGAQKLNLKAGIGGYIGIELSRIHLKAPTMRYLDSSKTLDSQLS